MVTKRQDVLQLKQVFKKFISASISGKRKLVSGKRISAGVIQNYQYALKQLEAYEENIGAPIRIVPLQKMNAALLARENKYWKRFFEGFSKFLYHDKGYYDNYVANTFKIVKTLFNYLKFELAIPVGDFHRLFKVPQQQPMPIVLLPEQLHYLICNAAFEKQLPIHLKRTKDIFVFGCTTGLRVSDLMQLKRKHLILRGDSYYLQVYTQKTSTCVFIPLPEYCVHIVKRYKNKSNCFLLPRLSNTNLNLHLKTLGKLANWTTMVPKYRTRKGKLTELKHANGTSWKFYEHITAHTMRRTAITTLLMLGVDEAVVRRISGHAPGSKEFYRYISLAQSYVDVQVIDAHKRLTDNPTFYRNK